MSSKNKSATPSELVSTPENEEESLIEFPCVFPIKEMGPATPEFHAEIEKIALANDPDFDKKKTTQNTSKTGKYVSLTLQINAVGKPQLDAIYKDLTDHELVLWAL